jgi:hypothetical protein
MVDANPQGAHMTWDVYAQTIKFCKRLGHPILLSGGEPTDHPEIIRIVSFAKNEKLHVTLISNGLFLQKPTLAEALLSKVDLIQITNDPHFYTHYVPDFNHPKVYIERKLTVISPFGRALKNNIGCNRMSPLCFNLRSVVRETKLFHYSLQLLALYGKFCTPSINIDGGIVAGEAPSCYQIGTVWDDKGTLAENLIKMKCNRCGLVENLPREYRQAIGEDY